MTTATLKDNLLMNTIIHKHCISLQYLLCNSSQRNTSVHSHNWTSRYVLTQQYILRSTLINISNLSNWWSQLVTSSCPGETFYPIQLKVNQGKPHVIEFWDLESWLKTWLNESTFRNSIGDWRSIWNTTSNWCTSYKYTTIFIGIKVLLGGFE